MKKIIIILIFITTIAYTAYFFIGKSKVTENNTVKLTTKSVKTGTIRKSIASTGRVVSNLDIEIKCKASGQIISLEYDVSDSVEKESLLVELDPVDEMRQVQQATVAVSASKAKLKKANQNYIIAKNELTIEKKHIKTSLKSSDAKAKDTHARAIRMEKLLKKNLSSKENYDAAKTAATQAESEVELIKIRSEELNIKKLTLGLKEQDIKLAKNQLESDLIKLDLANQRLKDTKILSPINGIVTSLKVQKGQIISSGISNVGGGTTIMTISDLSKLFILASVDESDIGKIKVNQQVEISVDAYPTKVFSGQVVRIASRGLNNSNVVTFEVKIEVLSENKTLLKLEMTANVEIIATKKDNVVLIPYEAVLKKDKKSIVYIMNKKSESTKREVVLGISDNVNIEIISGLNPGEKVIVNSKQIDSKWRKKKGGSLKNKRKSRAMRMMFGKRKSSH